MFDPSLFKRYEKLVGKIDVFCAELTRTFGPRLQCREGCALCCDRDIVVLPVEFYFLRSCPAITDAARSAGSNSRKPAGCTFLHQDCCTVYPYRPVICRTHGLPLLVRSAEGEQRDCCPLNAETLCLDELKRPDMLDLEVLNTLLSAVNLLFCKQTGLNPAQKRPLACLLDRE
jgi:uncharacterized protein